MGPRYLALRFAITVSLCFGCASTPADHVRADFLNWPSPEANEATDLSLGRWRAASTVALGAPDDVAAIKELVLSRMSDVEGEHSVEEIRWLSEDEAMVNASGSWATYGYVVHRGVFGWRVVVRYLWLER